MFYFSHCGLLLMCVLVRHKTNLELRKTAIVTLTAVPSNEGDHQVLKLHSARFPLGRQLYIVVAVSGGGTMNLQFEGAFAPPG